MFFDPKFSRNPGFSDLDVKTQISREPSITAQSGAYQIDAKFCCASVKIGAGRLRRIPADLWPKNCFWSTKNLKNVMLTKPFDLYQCVYMDFGAPKCVPKTASTLFQTVHKHSGNWPVTPKVENSHNSRTMRFWASCQNLFSRASQGLKNIDLVHGPTSNNLGTTACIISLVGFPAKNFDRP